MSILKTLKLAEKEKGQADPFRSAKTRLIQNLETQLKCAEAMVSGEVYMETRIETVEENGIGRWAGFGAVTSACHLIADTNHRTVKRRLIAMCGRLPVGNGFF